MQNRTKPEFSGHGVRAMTHSQRNTAILELLRAHTERNTVTRDAARKGLIAEGIYTQRGALRAEFGGEGRKAKTAA